MFNGQLQMPNENTRAPLATMREHWF